MEQQKKDYSWKKQSKRNWVSTDPFGNEIQPQNNEIKIGCLQRIADACELMSNNYSSIIADRNLYKSWYESGKARIKQLERKNAALRGHIGRMKRGAK